MESIPISKIDSDYFHYRLIYKIYGNEKCKCYKILETNDISDQINFRALKLIKEDDITDFEISNETEIYEYLENYPHPNIIKILDFIRIDINYDHYTGFVLEYAEWDLKDYLVNYDPPFSERQLIFKQIVYGLEFLHSHEIVYRDLKPENVLLIPCQSGYQIKLCDFGLSAIGKNFDKICGTLWYAAPEILNHQLYDKRVDLWSLGILLYVLFSLTFPFHDDNKKELMSQIISGKISNLAPEISQDLELFSLIDSLIRLKPSERLPISKIKQHPFWRKKYK